MGKMFSIAVPALPGVQIFEILKYAVNRNFKVKRGCS